MNRINDFLAGPKEPKTRLQRSMRRHPVVSVTVVTMLLTLIFGGVGSWLSRADAYVLCPPSVRQTQVQYQFGSCAPLTPRHETRRFRHHKLGNAKGYELPASVRKRLDGKVAAHTTGYSGDHWWDFPFNAESCIFWRGQVWDCTWRNGETAWAALKRDIVHTTRLAIACGGTSVIGKYVVKAAAGTVEETGWYGLGLATAGCMAIDVWNKWW